MPEKVAIVGSGNIGTDLMIKVLRKGRLLEMGALVGVDPASEGLARARRMGIPVTDQGMNGLLAMKNFDEIRVVFDATSAKAHLQNAKALHGHGKTIIDLTPAAIGPYVVPTCEPGRASKRAESQHGELRRSGDHSHGCSR